MFRALVLAIRTSSFKIHAIATILNFQPSSINFPFISSQRKVSKMKVSVLALLATLSTSAAFAPAAFRAPVNVEAPSHKDRKATIVNDGKANGT